jgi:hypothetical protein
MRRFEWIELFVVGGYISYVLGSMAGFYIVNPFIVKWGTLVVLCFTLIGIYRAIRPQPKD